MIELKLDAQGIATLTLDMPGRAMNVIDWPMVRALTHEVERLATDDAVKGVIITSAKRSFVAGADLAIMKDFVREGVTPRQAADLIATVGHALRRLETLGKPVVGASPGTALGGGLELLLACHHRIAVDAPGAVYGLPEVTLGLLPGAGGTQRLPRLIGIAKALPLLVDGTSLSTAEALALGLIDEVVATVDDLLPAAKRALTEGRVNPVAPWDRKGFRVPGGDSSLPALNEVFSATNGRNLARTQGLYPAPKAIVACVYEGSRLPIDKALRIEQMYFAKLVQGNVAQGLIRTMFFARQAADKQARQSPDAARDAARAAFVQRGQQAYLREGLRLLAEGAPPAVINNVALSMGMTTGPLALAAELGWDAELAPDDAVEAPGSGHDAGQAPLTPAVIAERLLAVQVLAAAQGLLSDASQTDLAAVQGWSFPACLGGPLSAIDSEGAPAFVARMNALAAAWGPRFAVPPLVLEQARSGARFHPH